MKTLLILVLMTVPLFAAEPDAKLYELRVYWAAEGKLDALHSRFRDHTFKLFEKHGMTNVGYWTPLDGKDHRLIYIVAHKDKLAQINSWKGFIADADWKKAHAESEKNGKLVDKIESINLTATDFSPASSAHGNAERVFELRTYVTGADKLSPLLERFKNHTAKLFEKHGMTNVGYWTLGDEATVKNEKLLAAVTAKGDDKADARMDAKAKETTLVYLLAHASDEARKQSFDAFRKDPEWIKAKEASEVKAGGPLTVKDGVKSLTLKATDYSPMK